jgi:hypothetical protein
MIDREREAARIGLEALDEVLVAHGEDPVHRSSNFHETVPVKGDIPNVVLEKPGAAPLRFVFGIEFDVWIGPFSEVVLLEASEEAKGLIRQRITDVLRSSVAYRAGKRSATIALRLPGAKPWLRLKVHASGLESSLEPFYPPYFGESGA